MINVAEILALARAPGGIDQLTYKRGVACADQDAVLRCSSEWANDQLVVHGAVHDEEIYHVSVIGSYDRAGQLTANSSCTCPLAHDCLHVVAVLIVQSVRTSYQDEQWRRRLDAILDEQPRESTSDQISTPTKLAIQLVLPRSQRVPSRAPLRALIRPRLAMRVVRAGAGERWVKTGMGWGELDLLDPDSSRLRIDTEVIDCLRQLKAALIRGQSYLINSNEPLSLQLAGEGIWPALTALAEADVPIVTSDLQVAITLAAEAAQLELDIAQGEGALGIRPGARYDERWYASDQLDLIGTRPHGVVLWERSATDGHSELILARLNQPASPALRTWFDSGEQLSVPVGAVDELIGDYLPQLERTISVRSHDGTISLPSQAEIHLRGELTWADDGSVELSWRWSYRQSDKQMQFPVEDTQSRRGLRDRARELELIDSLQLSAQLSALLGIGLYGRGTLAADRQFRQYEALDFARNHLPVLREAPQLELITNGDPPQFRELDSPAEIRFISPGEAYRKDRSDWLELDVIVSIEDEILGKVFIDLVRVLGALASGNTKIMVHRGVFVDVNRPEFDRLARLIHDARQLVDQPPTGIRVSRQEHDLLADLAEVGPSEGQIAHWSAASFALRALVEQQQALPAVPVPKTLTGILRPYQYDGYQWLSFLYRSRLGGILADDMGLGKTIQILAMISGAREAEISAVPDQPFLVIAPASVVGTWVSEAARFAPALRVVPISESMPRRGWSLDELVASAKPPDVIVTTYTLLRLEADQYTAISWAGLVLDEAQAVKNHQSKTFLAIRDLEARCRIAVTGTPIENNLMELWALLSLCAPGLFRYAAAFKDEYVKPIMQDADPDTLARLKRRIRPLILRRTKQVVATELPPKQEQVLRIELSPRHQKIYTMHLHRERQRILKLLNDLAENRITILASITRLRQLSLDPALIDPVYDKIGSAKIDALLDKLLELAAEGHRALVFSQFTGFLARVRARLDAEGLDYVYLDGATRKRNAVIDSFRNGRAPVFLISLKAGGVGLTLIEADYCFLLDPWWNPAVEAQAVGRVHRIGQSRPVMVYRMVAAGTIEEKVTELAAGKAELVESVLDADGTTSGPLSAADIASLLE